MHASLVAVTVVEIAAGNKAFWLSQLNDKKNSKKFEQHSSPSLIFLDIYFWVGEGAGML